MPPVIVEGANAQKEEIMKNRKLLKSLLIAMLAVCMFAMTACGKKDDKKEEPTKVEEQKNDEPATPDTTDATETQTTEPEQKAETFTVVVTDNEGATADYEMEIKAETLYDNLVENGLSIDGYMSDWGYYLTTVNGVTADYDADGAYWAIYVNGEYGMDSLDAQAVAAGDKFELVYTVYVATEDNTIAINVWDQNGEVQSYVTEIMEGEEYLSDIMNRLAGEEFWEFSYDGNESDWGFYLTTINGLTADYDADGAYWSIYVNDEYGQFGIDAQPVTSGDRFDFKYERYVAE